jgi:hypothetical protein
MAAAKHSESINNQMWITNQLDNISSTKANKEFVKSELSHVKDQIADVKDKIEEVDEKTSSLHVCTQKGNFEAITSMISSNKGDINSNAGSIKKLYTWQATVGISLLIFFLTVGVAALRYVDKLDFAVEVNKADISRIETSMKEEKSKDLSKEDLKKILKDALRKNRTQ